MLEFRWTTPAPASQAVVLRLQGSGKWWTPKTLTVGDRLVFKRGRFEGIEARVDLPGDPRVLTLTTSRRPSDGRWAPLVRYGDRVLEELGGAEPPRVVERPPLLSTVTGFVYLLMLVAVVVLPSIVRILNATRISADVIVPWILPFGVTGICLLGYWNMQRWGVVLWTVGVLLQAILGVSGLMPVSWAAVLLQVAGCGLGLAYWRRMIGAGGVS